MKSEYIGCMGKIMIYGCTGYTGQLIAEEAAKRKMDVLLAGRNAEKVGKMAAALRLPHVVCGLEDQNVLEKALEGVTVVLHCAGPFIETAAPMLSACMNKGVHYLDITGEIDVFEGCAALTEEAKSKGVMLMPGVGFDVVPTDCLAAKLKEALPEAQLLELVIKNQGGRMSHGTASTMLQFLGKGNRIRRNGKIVAVPTATPQIVIPQQDGSYWVAAGMPWGDVSTAYYTTGIPNIVVAFVLPEKQIKQMERSRMINWLLRMKFVRNIIQKRIDKLPAGPSAEQRAKSGSLIYGYVADGQGNYHREYFETPNGYTLTVLTGLCIAQKVQNGQFEPGFQTPAGFFGHGILAESMNGASV